MTKSYELVTKAIERNGDALFHCFTAVDSHVSKKNSRPIHRDFHTGRPRIGKSPRLHLAEAHLQDAFRIAILRQKGFEMISRPMWAVFLFYFPEQDYYTKKGQLSGRLPDLSNLYEIVQDSLQKSKVIKNDHLICSHDLSRRMPGDDYALEVFLFEYTQNVSAPLTVIK